MKTCKKLHQYDSTKKRCPECHRAHNKKSYETHKVQVRVTRHNYYTSHKNEFSLRSKQYVTENRDAIRAYRKNWSQSNLERIKSYLRLGVIDCSDAYIAQILNIPRNMLSEDTMVAKRAQLKLRRLIKELQK